MLEWWTLKKYIKMIAILFAGSFILVACSNNNENNTNDTANNTNENNNQANESNNTEEAKTSDTNGNKNSNQENESEVGNDKWGDDEMDLGMGDTGTLNSNVGKGDITLDSVEMVDDEDYEESFNGQYVLVHLTVNNNSDETMVVEDFLGSTELRVGDKAGGEMWDYYDDLSDDMPEEIDKGDESSFPLVFDAKDTEEYELKSGYHLENVSNKLNFSFTKDEVD